MGLYGLFGFFEQFCPSFVGEALEFVDDVLVFGVEEVAVASLSFEVVGDGFLFLGCQRDEFAWGRQLVFAVDNFVDWEHAGFDGEFSVVDGFCGVASPATGARCKDVQESGSFDFEAFADFG